MYYGRKLGQEMRTLHVESVLLMAVATSTCSAFQSLFHYTNRPVARLIPSTPLFSSESDDVENVRREEYGISRRDAFSNSAISLGAAAASVLLPGSASAADGVYKPAIRPTAYRVDSTMPPTLLPLKARQQNSILSQLGRGSGTDKEMIVVDTVNLNNMLNKAVFGTIDTVSSVTSTETKGPTLPSFVCLGMPKQATPTDVNLAVDILTPILSRRKKSASTALGLYFAPYSVQPALDDFIKGSKTLDELSTELLQAGVDEVTLSLYQPLLEFAKSRSIDLLSLSPAFEDIQVVRAKGLQNVDPERRSQYVVDPNGFIGLTQDPKYKVYTERSLFKDYESKSNSKEDFGNFYSERILVHEAAATAVSRYVTSKPEEALVAMVAPVPDLRFLNGINGRIPRISSFLLQDQSLTISNNSVTTILLNPTAADTLSKSRRLRLEIGTGPETLDFQSKVADYLWFSSSPKVNLIPRLMDG